MEELAEILRSMKDKRGNLDFEVDEAKVIVDKDLQIVGAEILAADAENVANMFAFIINKKITLEELDYMIYTFPSSSSVCLYKLHNIHYDL